jgi:hypothetical protein
VKNSFNIQELLHKSNHHGTKPMHPSSLRTFQRHEEQSEAWFSGSHSYKIKQNKLPFFIDRLVWHVPLAQVLPHPQLIFSFQNLVFKNLFEFSVAEITLKSISPTF